LGTVIPGDGIFAHRQGYNVLYGDGSARWQGDPQGTLIWMTLPVGPHGGIDTPYGTNCTAIANPDQLSYGVGIFNVFDDDVYPNSVWNGRRW
jgi:prepilin-type processing-associated H-X9-DG protein